MPMKLSHSGDQRENRLQPTTEPAESELGMCLQDLHNPSLDHVHTDYRELWILMRSNYHPLSLQGAHARLPSTMAKKVMARLVFHCEISETFPLPCPQRKSTNDEPLQLMNCRAVTVQVTETAEGTSPKFCPPVL